MRSILRKPWFRQALALLLSLILCLSPLSSLAGTYDIGRGDVSVTAEKDGETNKQTVKHGSADAVPDDENKQDTR